MFFKAKIFYKSSYELCYLKYVLNKGKLFKSALYFYKMRIKRITEIIGIKVYTDGGDFFGEVEEASLQENKIVGWKIKVGGKIMSLIGGARGVIIPHQFVRAISDVLIIKHSALPSQSESEFESLPEEEMI
jgi:sporulation protein YlmC with PRC-barrel domain